jgi:PilZ domain
MWHGYCSIESLSARGDETRMSHDAQARTAGHPAALGSGSRKERTASIASERRRSPRVDLLGELYGHIVTLDIPVAVRDMNLTGLLIETPVAFPVGAVHQFSLVLGDGSSVIVRGRVVRSRPVTSDDGVDWFESGVEFLDETGLPESLSSRTGAA